MQEKHAIRRRVRELGLRSDNAYLLRVLRAELAKPFDESLAQRDDIASLIARGEWLSEDKGETR